MTKKKPPVWQCDCFVGEVHESRDERTTILELTDPCDHLSIICRRHARVRAARVLLSLHVSCFVVSRILRVIRFKYLKYGKIIVSSKSKSSMLLHAPHCA